MSIFAIIAIFDFIKKNYIQKSLVGNANKNTIYKTYNIIT